MPHSVAYCSGVVGVSSRFPRLLVLALFLFALVPVTSAAAAEPFPTRTKLLAPGGAGNDMDGYAVAIDGDTLVSTAPDNSNASGSNVGAAYVYTRGATGWTLQQKVLPPAGVTSANFGRSVALDGDTLVVGDPSATTLEGASAGCVSVFVRAGTTWSVQATLTAPTGTAGDAFGTAVAVEGNRAVVGSMYSDAYAPNGGAAYVFERTGAVWDAGLLLPALAVDADDYHGIAVAVSGDTIAAGAPDDDGALTSNSGAVRVFVKSGAVWSQQATLIATDQGAGDSMGRTVALSGDTVLAGADTAYAPASYSGAAYVFTRSGTAWSQQAKLTPSDTGANIRFGSCTAIVGNRAIVGARSATAGVVPEAGAAYVFSRSGSAWSQEQKLVASDPASSDEFGYSIGFDGSKAVVGADYQSNANGAYAGASYVFESAAATSITIKTSATSVRTGNIPILAGKVTPVGMVGKIIVVYVKKPGKAYWSYSSNRGVYMLYGNAVWQYKYYFKPGMTKGYYYFRAAVPVSAGYLASGSSTISIRLR